MLIVFVSYLLLYLLPKLSTHFRLLWESGGLELRVFAVHEDYEAQNRNEPSWPSQCPEASHKSSRTHLKRTKTNSRHMLIEAWLQRPTQNGQAANHRDYLLTAAWNVGLAKHIGMMFSHCCAGSCTVG